MSASEAAGRQEQGTYGLCIYPQLSWTPGPASCCVPAAKDSTTAEVIREAVARLRLDGSKCYALAEVKEAGGEEWVLDASDAPVHRVLLWPRRAQAEHPREDGYYFLLQERSADGAIQHVHSPLVAQAAAARRLVQRGLLPPPQADVDDLCNLPELTEDNLLKSLKCRFLQQKIYTYAGSILVAVNPFKFLPIYNPKYVTLYTNQRLGKLEPHVFALADVAYYAMLRKRVNQCIVISGESGSGKTQSTNFLIHCLTALSQKGYASGVERTILGAGPVLEAFGNAKTAHNNNSSRFGKFIQVNYLESGIVRGFWQAWRGDRRGPLRGCRTLRFPGPAAHGHPGSPRRCCRHCQQPSSRHPEQPAAPQALASPPRRPQHLTPKCLVLNTHQEVQWQALAGLS